MSDLGRTLSDLAKSLRRLSSRVRSLEMRGHISILDDLADVDADSPADDNIIAWSVANNEWELATVGGGGVGAPSDAEYLVLALNVGLSDERLLIDGDGLVGTDAGAGGNYTLDVDLAAPSGLSFNGGQLQIDDAIAGAGLSIAGKVLSVDAGAGGSAPDDAQYLTLALDGDLSAERRFVDGDGLTGTDGGADGDYTLALTTPGTLTVSTGNAAAGSHTHAITTSSNPGAATSILASDVSGYLQLERLGLGISPTVRLDCDGGAIFNESGAAVDFRIETPNKTHAFFVDSTTECIGIGNNSPLGRLSVQMDAIARPGIVVKGFAFQSEDYQVWCDQNDIKKLRFDAAGHLKTGDWVSQTTGWRISQPGSADFRSIYADELHVAGNALITGNLDMDAGTITDVYMIEGRTSDGILHVLSTSTNVLYLN